MAHGPWRLAILDPAVPLAASDPPLDRRRALVALAAAPLACGRLAAAANEDAVEAERLTALVQRTFWDAQACQYRAPVRSAESVDSAGVHDRGYVLWPAIEALAALVEAEGVQPGRHAATIAAVVDGLAQYFDPGLHAYHAWLMYPGNRDTYYDDNALLVGALLRAFERTQVTAYRDRAVEVAERFLVGGLRDDAAGGVQWGTDPGKANTGDRAACATAMSALAYLGLARCGIAREANAARAARLLDWIRDRLTDTDGLVMDGLMPPDWRVRRVKWTYNTGVTLRANVELYRLTRDAAWLERARALGAKALNRGANMYDGLVRDPGRRCFYDSSYFVPYLVEGLLALWRETGDDALLAEVRRNAAYARAHLRDPADGLYWRNWRLWRIGDAQLARWQELTGQTHRLEADDSERSKDRRDLALPVAQRPLVKTLLANAGMARLWWLLAGLR
jgi:uncharacterized protein YyaL (SSP411 family)